MSLDVRFSNRPFRVKRFQTNHHSSVDVAHGLALLFGLGAKALPSWGFEVSCCFICHFKIGDNINYNLSVLAVL